MIDGHLTQRVIGLAMEVRRIFGPGLLESAYEEFLCIERDDAIIPYTRPTPISATHKGRKVDIAYRADILVGQDLILEIKSVDKLAPVHEAQFLTYLRLTGRRIGVLLNFNTVLLKDGMRRFVNTNAAIETARSARSR
jgi:GxxExxY protein